MVWLCCVADTGLETCESHLACNAVSQVGGDLEFSVHMQWGLQSCFTLPLAAGGGATCSEREQRTRGEDNRHMGTLSISVHEDKENAAQTTSLEAQTQGSGRPARGQEVTWPQLRACGG